MRIRATRFDDYGGIADLKARSGLAVGPREAWVSHWIGNPAYDGAASPPIGWVLESRNCEIVGSIEIVPFAYRLNGRCVRAGAVGGWAVDEECRGYSMLLLDRAMTQEGIDLVLTTTAGPKSERVFKALQWSRPQGMWNRSAVWIANHRRCVEVALAERSIPWRRLLSYPAAAALKCKDGLREIRKRTPNDVLQMTFCERFDERFDRLWEELEAEKKHALLAVRSRDVLSWHFGQFQLGCNGWVLTASADSRLVAYAIFDRHDIASGVLNRVRLIDFQALKGFECLVCSALRWMLIECRDKGIDVIENAGCWVESPSMLSALAPYHRTLPAWSFYYKARDAGLRETLKDPRAWSPSCFDGDTCLR